MIDDYMSIVNTGMSDVGLTSLFHNALFDWKSIAKELGQPMKVVRNRSDEISWNDDDEFYAEIDPENSVKEISW